MRCNVATAPTQIAENTDRLRGMCARRIVDAWIAWDLEHDTWFADLPVVPSFDAHHQLELCRQKFDELSISWNTP